jgi:CubicO group peptidase (beta-lactamase class C family)
MSLLIPALGAVGHVLSGSSAIAGADSLTAQLAPYVERHELAGAVMLVASKNESLSLEAVGYADISRKRPMRTDTLFWIASMSKPIAAAAFMMLVDEGKVNLDDPV